MRSGPVMRHVSAWNFSSASTVCRIRNLADGVPAAPSLMPMPELGPVQSVLRRIGIVIALSDFLLCL
jgi:hypothetical protein